MVSGFKGHVMDGRPSDIWNMTLDLLKDRDEANRVENTHEDKVQILEDSKVEYKIGFEAQIQKPVRSFALKMTSCSIMLNSIIILSSF